MKKCRLILLVLALLALSPFIIALLMLALIILIVLFIFSVVMEFVALAAPDQRHRLLLTELHKTGGRLCFFDINVYDAYDYLRHVEECRKGHVPEWRIHWAA